MKQEKPMRWCCVWRDITGPDNDPTLGCGHTSAQIRRSFEGSSTAEYCKEYLEDDPELKLKIDRITRETLMKNIHQLVVTDGHYAAAEAIVDYFNPERYDTPQEISCDDFYFIAQVNWGGNEGIYLDCYAVGRIRPDGPQKDWHLGTYKTLETSLTAMQTLGALGGALTYYAREYIWKNNTLFLSEQELRARKLKETQRAIQKEDQK